MLGTVLIVDDEKNIRRALRMVFEGEGLAVQEASNAEDGLQILETTDIDLVVLDVQLPNMNGIEALEHIRKRIETAKLPVLMISGHATVADAMMAVRKGATDFIEKPIDRDLVMSRIRNALKAWQLEKELELLRSNVLHRYEMIGQSPFMQTLFSQIEKVAPSHGRVLITGESGTGKELVARAIHRLSHRKDKPFIKVNCAAIPAELIEAELFGYEKGAFTGATQRKKGMFELAHQGTLLLDEIGDMGLSAQAKVLRVLQNGEITRVGSETSVAVDVRIIAATNHNLEEDVAEGKFREDLFFRLNVVPLHTPALRDRKEDIPQLANAFLHDFCVENGFRQKRFEPDVLDVLTERFWQGNVRELRNLVERLVILSDEVITLDDLPSEGRLSSPPTIEAHPIVEEITHDSWKEIGSLSLDSRPKLKDFRDKVESDYIVNTLEKCHWNISQTATILGIERTNLHKKMRSYGIRRNV